MTASAVLQSCAFGGSPDLVTTLVGGAVITFLATLLSGAFLTTFEPRYTDRMIDAVRARPLGSLLYGLLSMLTARLLVLLLTITVIAAPVALIVLVVAVVAAVLGATIVFLGIAGRLVDIDDHWLTALVLAAALNGGLVLTGVGGLVSLGAAAAGFGAMLNDYIG
ncbi:hypothetical protein [Halapricum desulfuricans]|uniref:Putative membrane protein related to bactofilin n=1 Tax=Halapricum desulfuricans TaxID=2841257 RepID=A0A897NKY7_9EURY|nr:hypothetical protein [Halapricum desulfuricans]QSG07777.1 putative membrane protein related to bactofilin [Halapricum desulfuricans]QSG13094.1 putative membrane protein related to bactofilin [Halapricum desulfuricans]